MTKKQKRLALLAGIAAASIWGGMYVVSDVVLEIIPPFTLLLMRLILGAIVLKGMAKFWKKESLSGPVKTQAILIGLVGYGVSLAFQFTGTKLSTAANGAIITSATPAFVVIFAYWLLGERLNFRSGLALVISTLGVLIVLDVRQAALLPQLFLGNLLLSGAALTWGLYSVLVRRTEAAGDMLVRTYWMFMGGILLVTPIAIVEIMNTQLGVITFTVLLGVLYLGVISTAVAMLLWNFAFSKLEAGVASLTFFAQPAVGAILSALLLKEKLPPTFFWGGSFIVFGLWLVSHRRAAT